MYNFFSYIDLINLINLDAIIVAFDIFINTREKVIDKECIIERYNNIYILNWIQRIILYNLLYISTRVLINPIVLVLFVIPSIQNRIIKIKYLNDMYYKIIDESHNLIKFIISKNAISYLRKSTGINISNVNILLLMNVIEYNWIYEFLQNMMFIWFLMVIRNYELTYYYYKGIKISYYYKTGYLINKIEKSQCIINIKEKIEQNLWYNMCKIECLTNIYWIIFDNFNSYNFLIDCRYNFIKFVMSWCIIDWIIYSNLYVKTMFFIYYWLTFKKKYILYNQVFFIFSAISSNEGNMILSFILTVFIIYKNAIYTILSDIIFYFKNYKSIKKVVTYKKKS